MTQMWWREDHKLDVPSTPPTKTERELENWIVNNPDRFGTIHDLSECYGSKADTIPFGRIVGRQIVVPSGIIDLLLIDDEHASLIAVELKKGRLDTKPFAQVMRYMHDLREMFFWVWSDLCSASNPDWPRYRYNITTMLEISLGVQPEITGMIIGHSLNDANLLTACEMANIDAYIYRKVGDDFLFFVASADQDDREHETSLTTANEPYNQGAPIVIRKAIAQIIEARSSEEKNSIVRDAVREIKGGAA